MAAALSGEAVVREVEEDVGVQWALEDEDEGGEGSEGEGGDEVEGEGAEESEAGEDDGGAGEGGEDDGGAGEGGSGVDPRRARMEAVRARMNQRSQVDRKKVSRR